MRRAFVLVGLLLLLGCGNRAKPPALLHGIYLGSDNSVSMKVPEDWELREGLERVPLVAMSPAKKGQSFRPSLTMVTVPLQEGETLEQFVARSLDEARKQVKNFRVVPPPPPASWAYYEHDYGGQSIEVMAYFMVREQTGYIFAFACAPGDAGETRKLFEAIAGTIAVDPEAYGQMKDLRETLQKHDEVVYEIKSGHKSK